MKTNDRSKILYMDYEGVDLLNAHQNTCQPIATASSPLTEVLAAALQVAMPAALQVRSNVECCGRGLAPLTGFF